MLAIIDYGMGNLRSVQKAFEFIGQQSIITTDKQIIKNAERVVLPGVGAFSQAIARLKDSGLDKIILDAAFSGKPFLGICLGMQLLYETSFEDGKHKGLGIIKGEIKKFTGAYKIPHIGWNSLSITKDGLFGGIASPSVYFVHSYYADVSEDTASVCNYADKDFSASIEKGNVFAAQFHPEKSGDTGLEILRNFVRRSIV
ncbi:MAG: imidazole glycerol phosphate synthase subunit HisH [Clostridia bacterium]|nr:imidazole glycerol phosphate synthase subunit HisH [Clostridia bacterium]